MWSPAEGDELARTGVVLTSPNLKDCVTALRVGCQLRFAAPVSFTPDSNGAGRL